MSNVTVFFDPLFQHEQTTENNIIRHIFERDLEAYNFNQALSHYKSTRICMVLLKYIFLVSLFISSLWCFYVIYVFDVKI